MPLKVKVGPIGLFDMLKFKNMKKVREKAISKAPATEVVGTFKINENAKRLHPEMLKLKVLEIVDHKKCDAKTYTFTTADNTPMPWFRPGQYLSLKLTLDGSEITRPYSICTCPCKTKDGKLAVTIKANPKGFAADKILKNLKVGDELYSSGPDGNFYYDSFRDAKHVIAIAGGSGITPFLSMARAIKGGYEDFNLTILYGSKKKDNILLYKELEEVTKATSKVKVVHVLSEDKTAKGFEHGFIDSKLILKYAPKEEEYSIFLCGPEAMYKFAMKEIKKLKIPSRLVRREMLGVTKEVSKCKGFPATAKNKIFTIKVKQGPKEFIIKANSNESILIALERAGIKAPSRCRSGECGWCRSRLIKGKVFIPEENEYRRWADKQYNYIHPCCSFALSNLEIEVPNEYLK